MRVAGALVIGVIVIGFVCLAASAWLRNRYGEAVLELDPESRHGE